MTEVEYVRYIVSKEGAEFSQEKKEHALSFELPKTYKALKSFVGLAEHFRRHVNNFVTLARPLHQLLGGYTQRKNKHQAISWTPENEAAFYTLQKALGASQKLYFVKDDWEIHMDTDASEYGIGAYLYQKGPNDEQEPIAFISKTLQPREQNWSVPEREGYAIFHAVTKLEHLLRDVRFVLHTDHENLTYLNCGNSKKVMRWKLFIQEFNFDLEYVKGELNIIADGFSRLVPKSENGEVSSDDIIHTLASFHDFLLPEDKREIICKIHNSQSGHFGVEKTTQKLLDLGHNWTHMREHVKTFIKKCPCCQKMSYLKPVIHTHPFTLGTYQPMERVAIDTMGPLEADETGNRYIIVIIDCFSRYCLLIPSPDATAKSAAKALLQHVGMFGVMNQLLSDMGTQYVNQIIDEMMFYMGVEKLDTLPGIHEENGIVESRNREVLRHLKAMIFHRKLKSDWSTVLPLVQRILNSERMEGLSVSPSQILFGNSITLDRGIFLPFLPPTTESTPDSVKVKRLSDWMANMLKQQAQIIALAQETQSESQRIHFQKYSSETPTEFPLHSYVLVRHTDESRPSKLNETWRGPYKVVSRDEVNLNRYTVQNLVTEKLYDFPNKLLKFFIPDDAGLSPLEVAMTDEGYEIVEDIVSHSPKKLKPNVSRNKMTFGVKYLGDKEIKQTPYSLLKDNEVLHQYLAKNKLKFLIPSKYTWGRNGPPTDKA